jgi:hypothetical protein
VTHSHGLNDEEYAALRALQEAAPAPPVTDPVWSFMLSAGIVSIDKAARPPTVRLTPAGRRYPSD